MFFLYPSNQMENLVVLLERVLSKVQSDPFRPEVVVVQNKGMQHWLKLQLAEIRRINMNTHMLSPVQFFWRTLEQVLGKDSIPDHPVFSREILVWRIFQKLDNSQIMEDPLFSEANRYWLEPEKDDLKGFQLSKALADLFEQYLIYRPDWVLKWEKESPVDAPHWQAKLWSLLFQETPNHLLHLLKSAKKAIQEGSGDLPDHVFLFGINSLPPHWLAFLSDLAKVTQVHLFYLNPSQEFWGDLHRGDLHRGSRDSKVNLDETAQENTLGNPSGNPLGNPLLSGWGKLGRDFLNLLQTLGPVEIPAFCAPVARDANQQTMRACLLHQVQNDIFSLQKGDKNLAAPDPTVHITSSHSRLREVQYLHDWLLKILDANPEMDPKDIVVMCPNIEEYAPFIHAVFAKSGSEWQRDQPKLPCTIADRHFKDIHPLLGLVLELLNLQTNRFSASTILSILRFQAIQAKWGLTDKDLERYTTWIQSTGIHWGLNREHRNQVIGKPLQMNSFTWDQGMERLLLGCAFDDQPQLYGEYLLHPVEEGEERESLGILAQFLDNLNEIRQALQEPKTAIGWKQFISQLKTSFFEETKTDLPALQGIEDALTALVLRTTYAQFNQPIPVDVLRNYLEGFFQGQDSGHQFLNGKITFCSLVPMRSIPFKTVAILGLNDDEFPRSRIPLGFDLMSSSPPRIGDRSRKDEDRYLFLEALLSARQYLYLSFTGRDQKTNQKKEPSLVLDELIEYLRECYAWDSEKNINQTHLQPFNVGNYSGENPSYDPNWMRLAIPSKKLSEQSLKVTFSPTSVEIDELVRFFENPLKAFAQFQMGLFFQEPQSLLVDDEDPFSLDRLNQFSFQKEWIQHRLLGKPTLYLKHHAERQGLFPDSPRTEQILQDWIDQAEAFFGSHLRGAFKPNQAVKASSAGISLQAKMEILHDTWIFWKPSLSKPKDKVRLWLHHLLAQVHSQKHSEVPVRTKLVCLDKKKNKVEVFQLNPFKDADMELNKWIHAWENGMQSPILLHADLGVKAHETDPPKFQTIWEGNAGQTGLVHNPYNHYFFPKLPSWDEKTIRTLTSLYSNLVTNLADACSESSL